MDCVLTQRSDRVGNTSAPLDESTARAELLWLMVYLVYARGGLTMHLPVLRHIASD